MSVSITSILTIAPPFVLSAAPPPTTLCLHATLVVTPKFAATLNVEARLAGALNVEPRFGGTLDTCH